MGGEETKTIVRLPSYKIANGLTVEVEFAADALDSMKQLEGIRGMTKRGTAAKAELDLVRTTPGAHESGFGALDRLAILGDDLSRLAGNKDVNEWKKAVAGASTRLMDAVAEVKAMKKDGERTAHVLALLNI